MEYHYSSKYNILKNKLERENFRFTFFAFQEQGEKYKKPKIFTITNIAYLQVASRKGNKNKRK